MRRSGVAAITALLVVVAGLLASHHEASTPHVHDRAGAFFHASALASEHLGHDSDVHGQRDPGADAGACAVLTAHHEPASAGTAPPTVGAAQASPRPRVAPRRAVTTTPRDVLATAPKTSPPA